MTTLTGIPEPLALSSRTAGAQLAAAITRASSAQSYYIIRLLADRDCAADAYRAYAYFRWIDDRVDEGPESPAERAAFLRRQQALLEAAYRGAMPDDLCPEERMLAELVAGDEEADSGLQTYLRHMMAVMAIDVERRGRLISAVELDHYIELLATAVSEALLHFLGRGCAAPRGAARHRAVRGACIIHMLRDTFEDLAAGYVNVPAEYLAERGIGPGDVEHPAYCDWAAERVALARDDFRAGRAFIAQVGSARCRLAGRAYIARFEYVARLIERDGYRLRPSYPERKSTRAALWMVGKTITN